MLRGHERYDLSPIVRLAGPHDIGAPVEALAPARFAG